MCVLSWQHKKLNEFSRKFLGVSLFNVTVPLSSFNEAYDEESRNIILSGRLIKVDGGLYQVFMWCITAKISQNS